VTLEKFYVFIDTNLLYDTRLDYKLFNTGLMKEILKVRNNYNGIFGDHKQIFLHFTEIVVKEVFSIKNEVSKQKLLDVINTVQYLERETLKAELETARKNFTQQLISNGELFISENEIIKVPCCSDCYFKNIVKKSGRVLELLINSEKASTSHVFNEYIERFLRFQFSMIQTHDQRV